MSVSVEIVTNKTWDRREFEELAQKVTGDRRNQVKSIIINMATFNNIVETFIMREGGEIVALASIYIKNNNNDNLRSFSLYNIVSFKPKRGKEILQAVWDEVISRKVNFYTIHVFHKAYRFYTNLGFRFWGIDKSGETLFSFGKILDHDIEKSNNLWYNEPLGWLDDEQHQYVEKIMTNVLKKHKIAMTKTRALKNCYEIFMNYEAVWKQKNTIESIFQEK